MNLRHFFWGLTLGFTSLQTAYAQFAPAAGNPTSTAIHRDSSSIINWASSCILTRGPMDISQPQLGLASTGEANNALGKASGQVVSLGDRGIAQLGFDYPIKNGQGPDFAIFENAFNATFLELAFVEVSSDGVNYVRFPAISRTQDSVQIGSFGAVDPEKLYNFAGKYQAQYGTPFDLEELKDSSNIDINQIQFVRIIDAVGCVQANFASIDSEGNLVNDIWPTPFASSGFDLDAVAVLHQNLGNSISLKKPHSSIRIYPNPLEKGQLLKVETKGETIREFSVYNSQGKLLLQGNDTNKMNCFPESGIYYIELMTIDGFETKKVIIK